MDGLHCDGDEDAGDKTSDVACCRCWVVRGGGREPVIGAGHLDRGLLPECSNPFRHTSAVENAETGTSRAPAAQYRGAQRLVALRGVRRRDDQAGLIRFFLRASARSRLRRCTLIPNRVSIAPTHCEVVRAGLAVLRSATKATTSVEIFGPPLGPRLLGSRPARPVVCSAFWAL